ncbi:hypothetical protein [Aeromonas hydrophila]|uniref:hypothetical protein n=1 Tax=Aeromonas hydrophila TaxID=644 RepID=UPI0023609417|nr:hypothetical protein [Aeromonas hydrophila]
MEDDLSWLARNVHEWKIDTARTISYDIYEDVAKYGDGMPFNKFTKDQWLACRAELQNKPSWKDAPEWVLSVSQRSNGEWFWLGSTDQFKGPSVSSGCIGEVLGDWRDTLERRPESKPEFEQFVSIEDGGPVKAQVDGGWFERGELPPVGIRCEAYIDQPPQWIEAEIVAHRDGFAIGWCNSVMKGCHGDKASEFRPIRTERDNAIEEMKSHCPYHGNWVSVVRIYAEALYDAGYRKQEVNA